MHELFDIITERSGKAGQIDRDAFFAMKTEYYKLHHRPVSGRAHAHSMTDRVLGRILPSTFDPHPLTPLTMQAKLVEPVMHIVKEGQARGLPMAVASGGTVGGGGRIRGLALACCILADWPGPHMLLHDASILIPLPPSLISQRHHVMKGLTETGIVGLFQAIVCGEDVERGKPAPDAFLLAAKQLGIPPEDCVGYEGEELRQGGMGCRDSCSPQSNALLLHNSSKNQTPSWAWRPSGQRNSLKPWT